jgi:hypothetical protein
MDLNRIIRELVLERDRVQKIIDSLEGYTPMGKGSAGPAAKRRGRKFMDGDARREVSERMKRYWAQRRGEQDKPGKN